MKQNFTQKQTHKQTLNLSLSMKKSLDILSAPQEELYQQIKVIADKNPYISYTPSIDMDLYMNEALSHEVTLSEELYLQLHVCKEKYDKHIAEYIIESLDENGFFTLSISESSKHLNVSVSEFKKTLKVIQGFEPVGVAAKDSFDSIILQLQYQNLDDCIDIFQNHGEELIKNDLKSIAKKKGYSIEEIQSYIEDIRLCNPFPCEQYVTRKVENIIPDLIVNIEDNNLVLSTNELGNIILDESLNEENIKNNVLKAYFKEALFFIDSLSKRNKTLLLLANELFQIQKNYFLFHDELQTCTLAMIAKNTGFHESTVSRTLSNKYYSFQNEVFPIKKLFVSSTTSGDSKDSIIKAVHDFIKNEDPSNPLRDIDLVDKLNEIGLSASRRTIAKYRMQLRIPNSKDRIKKIL